MKRIIALDLGTKKTGVALSDPLQIIAQAYCVIKYQADDWSYLITELKKIVEQKKPIDYFIIGYPLSLNNSQSMMSEKVLKFKDLLIKNFEYKVILEDEKFSSKNALKIMTDLDLSIKNKKKSRDALAAQIILEQHLNKKGN